MFQLLPFLSNLNDFKLYWLQVLRQKATSIQQDYAEVKSTNVRTEVFSVILTLIFIMLY